MKDIKGFEGKYAVTRNGRVWSYPKWKGFYTQKGMWLKGYKLKNGYVMLCLWKNKKPYNLLLHRVVAVAFIPNVKKLKCVNHLDCNPSNNEVKNLEWVTHKGNSEYMVKMGRNHHGEEHHNAKLTDENVIEIRYSYSQGKISYQKLGNYFGVSKKTILNIIHRKIWIHI